MIQQSILLGTLAAVRGTATRCIAMDRGDRHKSTGFSEISIWLYQATLANEEPVGQVAHSEEMILEEARQHKP